jgi:glutamyl-tRNA reductase
MKPYINMIDHKEKSDQIKDSLIVIGANHRSSTMLLRDRLYIPENLLPSFYKRLGDVGFDQVIIISTTDLTEFIFALSTESVKKTAAEVIKLLSAHAGESRDEIENQTYTLTGHEAVRHIFALASALDSLVIGDSQLMEQLRVAHRLARHNGITSNYLENLVRLSQKTVERILRETEIGQRPVSIAAAAVQVARDLHGNLARSSCLLIGSGEMGKMLASSMRSAGLVNLIVSHPSPMRSDTLGQHLNCHVGSIENLAQMLTQSDIVITSMNTRRYILDTKALTIAAKARKRKPILVIDTGVPGDVNPAVEVLEDIFLYTLDDLERVTRDGRASRAEEAKMAWSIVDAEAIKINSNSITKCGSQQNLTNDSLNDFENLRQVALKKANGDAEKATRLLLDLLKDLLR